MLFRSPINVVIFAVAAVKVFVTFALLSVVSPVTVNVPPIVSFNVIDELPETFKSSKPIESSVTLPPKVASPETYSVPLIFAEAIFAEVMFAVADCKVTILPVAILPVVISAVVILATFAVRTDVTFALLSVVFPATVKVFATLIEPFELMSSKPIVSRDRKSTRLNSSH